MSSGAPDRWGQADDLFDAALDLPAEQRAAFLDRTCAADRELRSKVERLLRSRDRATHFLEEPASVFGAALFVDTGPSALARAGGTRIGPYTIIEEIGQGGMGVVYKARDERLDRVIALKFLPPDLDADEDARGRLVAEAKVASALDHPGIAVVHEIGETAAAEFFIAMAHYEGETLAAKIARGSLTVADALELTMQIAGALAAAHRKGIVHRDIKPANVIVTPERVAKIVDFGIAQIAGTQTAAESTRGTLAYMSPEQLRGDAVDARTDLWSLGVVLYEMLTGQCPFRGGDRGLLMRAIQLEDPEPVASVSPAVPPELAAMVDRCLAKDRADRYPEADELLGELQAIRQTLDDAPPETRRLAVLPLADFGPDTEDEYKGAAKTVVRIGRELRVGPRFGAVRTRRAALAGVVGVAVAGAAGAAGALLLQHATPREAPVIAVGWIDHESATGEKIARILPGLLETALAQVLKQQTISNARLYEVLGELGSRGRTRSSITGAARHAGATQLLEGALYRRAGQTLRLDLRRVDVQSGVVLGAYVVEAENLFELADRAATRIAADLELPAPVRRVAELTSTSLVAQSFYEEGLRTFYQIDVHRSNPFFRVALREDSTCAMCAYYAAISERDVDPVAALHDFRTARRLAKEAPERERLQIQMAWNWFAGVPSLLSVAESLAVRDPNDPWAQYHLGVALANDGRRMEAVTHLRRAIALDSLGLRGLSPRCRACDMEAALIGIYWAADSFPAAERTARAWIRAQPRSSRAWYHLALTYGREGRYGDARAAQDTAARLGPADADHGKKRALLALRRGDFRAADAYFSIRARNGSSPLVRQDALWWLVISLRNQGRLDEALATVEHAGPVADSVSPDAARSFELARGQILFELGHFREAAALFDSLAHHPRPDTEEFPGIRARNRVWAFTHEAAALAALGDTAAVAALADVIERLGPASAYGRDRLLHHHLRGLVLNAHHDWPGAEAEFRKAIYSITVGYTRTNLELARVLLAEHRPGEAIAVLEPALRGSLEASNFYVTRTEIYELLGQTFASAGEPDSAAVQYRRVLNAWRAADPRFHARRDGVRARLAALQSERL